MKTPWEKEYERLRKLVSKGDIEVNANFFLVTIDDIVMQMRIDMLPAGADASEEQSKEW